MKEITCYKCNGVFWIDEKYRVRPKRLKLKLKKDHIAEDWVKDKTKWGIHCPYCPCSLLPQAMAKYKKMNLKSKGE